ncbi:ATP F0F1 synthase subunit B [Salipiger aestuarii]|uniref:ATP synthase subunit b n=1 Tax=Salipiger aestuarii TaxID=568098 RepID=A0A327YKT2_9RHOB|nr:F0F1 ATP synthase subunit B [Salipiger aestuarii]EIE50188.1 F0F1 ATP synthase subunit B [Citreicella sp. 357]KAA8609966.1 ATP F0F1 synthase subunit B [Salipiger aestuarii]KAB2543226.1 ATP F0F1 synthase subunit B [Salipiger aestuarii]RAK21553.1 F-type H+-transporting ATPase subunit b [Salipiger aestuarii]
MRKLILSSGLAAVIASPALAATGPFFSLRNTDFVVLLGFLLFLAVLAYFKVPGLLGGLLDKRAQGIRDELDEARALREEAQTLLASYERKQKEVADQADKIVANARTEAETAAVQAHKDLDATIARRMASAEERIASAQASAVKDVRDRAAMVAVAAARDVIAQVTSAADKDRMIDESIDEVGAKLH